MKTEELVIDMNNLYVQGLIKVINDFMLEEASGCIFTEDRLKSNIEKLKDVFPEERKRMVIAGRAPMFSSPTSGLYKLIFKKLTIHDYSKAVFARHKDCLYYSL